MAVKIDIDKSKVLAKVETAYNKGLAQLSMIVLDDCNRYCKEREGTLIQSSYIHSEPNEGKLIWQTPYAKRQYWEIKTAYKDKNPEASYRWCEVAKRKHKEQWERQAQKLFEENI